MFNRAILYLILGAVASIACTWILAIYCDIFWGYRSHRIALDHQSGYVASSTVQWGASRVIAAPDLRPDPTTDHLSTAVDGSGQDREIGVSVPGWLILRSDDLPPLEGTYERIVIDAFGWPCRALSYRFSVVDSLVPVGPDSFVLSFRGGLRLRDHYDPPGWRGPSDFERTRGLPLTPLWTGLMVNTILYALAIAVLYPIGEGLVRAVRRRIRQRLGLCVRCGYDLRGLDTPGCPECGWGR